MPSTDSLGRTVPRVRSGPATLPTGTGTPGGTRPARRRAPAVPDEAETLEPGGVHPGKPDSVRRLALRNRERRRQAAAPWLVGLMVAAILALIGWAVFGTSLLGVSTVKVTGTHILRPDQVRATAQVSDGTPLARLD